MFATSINLYIMTIQYASVLLLLKVIGTAILIVSLFVVIRRSIRRGIRRTRFLTHTTPSGREAVKEAWGGDRTRQGSGEGSRERYCIV